MPQPHVPIVQHYHLITSFGGKSRRTFLHSMCQGKGHPQSEEALTWCWREGSEPGDCCVLMAARCHGLCRRQHPVVRDVLPTPCAPGRGAKLQRVIQTTGLGKTSPSWQMLLTWVGFRKTEVTKPCFSLQWEIQREKSMFSCKKPDPRKRRKEGGEGNAS